ncbi:MAG: tRNA (adenosine(37)-N6)-threonylcarbamoyltransferase complex ATPase subunit type 1 TsaE [Nitrospirota bacterium]
MLLSITTDSPEETKRIGENIGRLMRGGEVVVLEGELGAGKTCFVHGIAKGLDVKDIYISSPTFVYLNEYNGRIPLYHCDLYRIKRSEDIEDIGILDLMGCNGVLIIEWGDKANPYLPEDRLYITITNAGGDRRRFDCDARGRIYIEILKMLKRKKYHAD